MALNNKDRKAILACLRRVYSAQDLAAFRAIAIDAIAQLVDSEATSYNEVNAAKNSFHSHLEPGELQFPGCEEIFLEHIDEHPLVNHNQKYLDGQARKISDFISQRQYRQLGIYCDLYRALGAEYQMSVCLPAPPGRIVGLAVNRRSKDFSERERMLLNTVRPHLAQAYENASIAAELKRALELGDLGMILASAQGQVLTMTPKAEQWLGEFFAPATACHLPEELQARVARALAALRDTSKIPEPTTAWEITRTGQTLIVRLAIDEFQDRCLLVLEKKQSQFSPAALESLGLGRREAEVLFWVAQGKTNQEIAAILGLSYGTVKKHLDRVYDKLGVENRVAAIMHGLRALGIIADKP